ncbi:hypothetical protein L6164_023220 [Bauhinia variegata]|uniref:Uncharacterized protein n=1 Tax=Bauhinia variegata TaxID=167791 RepID=A0ACB9MJG1_BAUVA|nr:hypothetical protein L6164_023220 [Bauhinia variegata]
MDLVLTKSPLLMRGTVTAVRWTNVRLRLLESGESQFADSVMNSDEGVPTSPTTIQRPARITKQPIWMKDYAA